MNFAKVGDLEDLINSGDSIYDDDPHVLGYNSLTYACENEHIGCVKYLLSKNVKIRDALIVSKNRDIIIELVNAGADINYQNISKQFALLYSVSDVYISQYLIEHGANVNLCDIYGSTPLSMACVRGNLETVKLLVKSGAQINVCDIDGYSPFYWASELKHISIVKYLLPYVDINPIQSSTFSREIRTIINTYIFNKKHF